MAIYEHLGEFAGLPVVDFTYDTDEAADLPAAGAAAWRVSTGFDEKDFTEVFADFLRAVDTTEVTALIFGYWGASYDQGTSHPVPLLVEAAERFPRLRALFIGDIVMEEAEVSWIEQTDITPALQAFPGLERLEVRGGGYHREEERLRLSPFRSEALTLLRVETGGLPGHVARAVAASDLPNLEHLDLWLGVDQYGGDATVADLAPILSGERLPALRRLGLENAGIQDEVAAAVASAPIVARLETLSLAMGALTDAGAEALLSGQPLTHLKKLDLHHHYLTEPMQERVRKALPGVDVDLGEPEDPADEWRWVSVSE